MFSNVIINKKKDIFLVNPTTTIIIRNNNIIIILSIENWNYKIINEDGSSWWSFHAICVFLSLSVIIQSSFTWIINANWSLHVNATQHLNVPAKNNNNKEKKIRSGKYPSLKNFGRFFFVLLLSLRADAKWRTRREHRQWVNLRAFYILSHTYYTQGEA